MSEETRILIIDDTEEHRRLIGRVLRAQGYDIQEAGNCEQALEKLRNGKIPHLLIIDQFMPLKTGTEFWNQIQSDENFKHVHGIPAIFITAYHEDLGVKELKAKGIPVLAKPLSDPTDIAEIVRSVLAKHRTIDEEISQALTQAQTAFAKEQWVEASKYYSQSINWIEQMTRSAYSGDASKVPELVKDQALECWMGYIRCQFTLRTRDSSMFIWDSPNVNEYENLERKICAYKTRYPIKLWNGLYQMYVSMEIECHNNRMPRTADALHHFSIKARKNLYYYMAVRGGKDKPIFQRLKAFGNATSASIELMLDHATVGILWSVLLMIAFIVLFAVLYRWSDGIRFDGDIPLPRGFEGFLYALYFSVFVFTGTGSGALTTTDQFSIIGLMVLESIVAFIFTVVVIGYVVNRLSSR